jgi:hypothetical protein
MQMSRQHLQRLFQLPAANPLLESAVAGLVRRIFLRQLAPLRSCAQHPEHTVQHGPRIVPRSAAVVLTSLGSQHPLHHGPLFVTQFPASCHGPLRYPRAAPGSHENASQVFMRLVLVPKWDNAPFNEPANSADQSYTAVEVAPERGAFPPGRFVLLHQQHKDQ